MATEIKFYAGARAKYNSATHIGFYVSTDTDELLYNGKSLGDIVDSYTFDAGGKLTLTMKSGKTVEIEFPAAVASAEGVEGQAGLLSAADKAKIDGMDAAVEDALSEIEEALKQLEEDIVSKCIIAGQTTVSGAYTELQKLDEGYRTLHEVAKTLHSFLNDVDASDEKINKWKEIETFLGNITDTQTLTGLLADASKIYITEVE